MSELKIKPTTDGRLIARLYGKEFDVTGMKELTAFGQTYTIAVKGAKTETKTTKLRKPKIITEKELELEEKELKLEKTSEVEV